MFVNHSLKIKIDLNLKNGPSFFFLSFFFHLLFGGKKCGKLLRQAMHACTQPEKKNQSRQSNSNVAQCFRSQTQQ